ncbi:MAG: Rrf2 family transcriptional regulator [Gammaproteobacteria bacterium]|nr:Rrf2 family transcriptional regulator [Gammaproteobacteria bacterium]
MRLTTKGRYAVTAMMDLAIHEQAGPVTLTEIAASQQISLSYLEQLFAALRKAGLVHGLRGPGGGYRLAQPANDISIARIIAAVDEKVDVTRCGGDENCQEGERCLTHTLWSQLSQQLYDFLDRISLGEVIQWPSVQEVATRQDAWNGRENRGSPGTSASPQTSTKNLLEV